MLHAKKCAYRKFRENPLLSFVLIGLCIHTPCLRTKCIAQQPDYDSQSLYTNKQLIDLYLLIFMQWTIRYIKYGFCSIFRKVIVFVVSLFDWNYSEMLSDTLMEMGKKSKQSAYGNECTSQFHSILDNNISFLGRG